MALELESRLPSQLSWPSWVWTLVGVEVLLVLWAWSTYVPPGSLLQFHQWQQQVWFGVPGEQPGAMVALKVVNLFVVVGLWISYRTARRLHRRFSIPVACSALAGAAVLAAISWVVVSLERLYPPVTAQAVLELAPDGRYFRRDTSLQGTRSPGGCPATPSEDRLPEVIAAMKGEDPIWLVDGSSGRWSGAEMPVKSVWVISRAGIDDLMVTGRLLNGTGKALFQVGSMSSRSARLDLSDLDRLSVVPGGATPAMMVRYAFVPGYLYYPGPGCWQLSARFGEEERRIVIELVDPSSDGD